MELHQKIKVDNYHLETFKSIIDTHSNYKSLERDFKLSCINNTYHSKIEALGKYPLLACLTDDTRSSSINSLKNVAIRINEIEFFYNENMIINSLGILMNTLKTPRGFLIEDMIKEGRINIEIKPDGQIQYNTPTSWRFIKITRFTIDCLPVIFTSLD